MPSHKTELDHIVVVAPTLEIGADYVRRTLGAEPQPGGAHARMGTHNLLLRLGPNCYLEIIAIDPAAPLPDCKRWFDIDRLPKDAPAALTTWVARTDNLDSALAACSQPLGKILPMTRAALEWRITVPVDGHLPGGGVLPTLIQWGTPTHPATGLKDSGVSLQSLTLCHPDLPACLAILQALNFVGPVSVVSVTPSTPPYVVAYFDTPLGRRILSSLDKGGVKT